MPPRELSVEVSRENLQAYGLTLDGIAQQIRSASMELPGGGVKTDGGELLVRVSDRRRTADDFKELLLRSTVDGAQVRLGDIAEVVDGYEDNDQSFITTACLQFALLFSHWEETHLGGLRR